MGFYQEIRERYGLATVKRLKHLATLNTKHASLTNRRIFLLKCRQHNIYPNHITQGLKNINSLLQYHEGPLGHTITNFNNKVRRRILNIEISITISNLNKIDKDKKNTKLLLSNILPNQVLIDYDNSLFNKYNRTFNSIKRRNRLKLNKLRQDVFAAIRVPNKWIKNISNVNIPPNVSKLLALGPGFCLDATLKLPQVPKLLADLEFAVSQFSTHDKNLLRGKFTNIITNHIHKNHNNSNVFHQYVKETKSFLQQHPNLIVTMSDKGNVTVVMDSADYNTLSSTLLRDNKYYVTLPRDPTSTMEQRANRLVTKLRDSGEIDDNLSKTLHNYSTIAPRFYALPKIHKPVLSLRPIISSIDAPNGNIAKFLTSILTQAYNMDNDFYIKDSFTFSTFINDFQLPPDYILISLDVVSLFTNLPLDLAKTSIIDNWNIIQQHTTLNLNSFLQLLDFTFNSTYFIFNNTFFKQIFGTPMGSSISPILSSYVLDNLISAAVNRLQFPLPFIKRYVDDLILSVPRNMVQGTLQLFNAQNEYIQFTVEEESNQMIPFLDMHIIRNNNNVINTRWYRKPISSGRYLNYYSCHPTKMKLSLVSAMRSRVLRLSHSTFQNECLTELRDLFLENSYPPKLLHELIFSPPVRVLPGNGPDPVRQQITHNSLPDISYISLPFFRDLTPRLINIFKGLNLKIATKLPNKLQFLYTKLKSPINLHSKTNIVYSLPCHNCNCSYIGQTSRNLKGRITSHKSDCRRGVRSCALAEHVLNNDHLINYDEASILYHEPNYTKRKFLEMVAINNNPLNMNKRSDTEDLCVIYSYILKLTQDSSILDNTVDS